MRQPTPEMCFAGLRSDLRTHATFGEDPTVGSHARHWRQRLRRRRLSQYPGGVPRGPISRAANEVAIRRSPFGTLAPSDRRFQRDDRERRNEDCAAAIYTFGMPPPKEHTSTLSDYMLCALLVRRRNCHDEFVESRCCVSNQLEGHHVSNANLCDGRHSLDSRHTDERAGRGTIFVPKHERGTDRRGRDARVRARRRCGRR